MDEVNVLVIPDALSFIPAGLTQGFKNLKSVLISLQYSNCTYCTHSHHVDMYGNCINSYDDGTIKDVSKCVEYNKYSNKYGLSYSREFYFTKGMFSGCPSLKMISVFDRKILLSECIDYSDTDFPLLNKGVTVMDKMLDVFEDSRFTDGYLSYDKYIEYLMSITLV